MTDQMKVLETSPEMLGYIREAIEDELPGQRINANLERQVCPECHGDGTTWHGWGGRDAVSFTSTEWSELDEDERDGYMSGRYDGPCPECKGRNVVDFMEISEANNDPEVFRFAEKYIDEYWAQAAADRQERMMGC